jgi:hypothetical protein
MWLRITIAMLTLGVTIADATAGDQDKELPEQLPPPKLIVPAPLPEIFPDYYRSFPPPPPRLDSRNAWSLFAPNSMGQMRMRVIQAPYGSYYLYNGEPYYGIQTRSPYILPRTTN